MNVRIDILLLCTEIALLISSRLSAVDPWFNFRATKYLVQHGFYSFWDWFDDSTYYRQSVDSRENWSLGTAILSERSLRLTTSMYRNMASAGTGYWRDAVPRLDGNERRNLPSITTCFTPRRYSKHMCAPGPRILRPDCRSFLSHYVRNDHIAFCRTLSSGIHGHCAWIHLEIRSWELR